MHSALSRHSEHRAQSSQSLNQNSSVVRAVVRFAERLTPRPVGHCVDKVVKECVGDGPLRSDQVALELVTSKRP